MNFGIEQAELCVFRQEQTPKGKPVYRLAASRPYGLLRYINPDMLIDLGDSPILHVPDKASEMSEDHPFQVAMIGAILARSLLIYTRIDQVQGDTRSIEWRGGSIQHEDRVMGRFVQRDIERKPDIKFLLATVGQYYVGVRNRSDWQPEEEKTTA